MSPESDYEIVNPLTELLSTLVHVKSQGASSGKAQIAYSAAFKKTSISSVTSVIGVAGILGAVTQTIVSLDDEVTRQS